MKKKAVSFWLGLLYLPLFLQAQSDIRVPAEREQMFRPYLAVRYGGMDSLDALKNRNPSQYYKEMWYYASSFYIKKNHYPEGHSLFEQYIDISRFEKQRQPDQETFIRYGGSCDAIVLLPGNGLLHKPSFIK